MRRNGDKKATERGSRAGLQLAAHDSRCGLDGSGLEERAQDRERVERHVCVRAAGIMASVRDAVSEWRSGGGRPLPRLCAAEVHGWRALESCGSLSPFSGEGRWKRHRKADVAVNPATLQQIQKRTSSPTRREKRASS